MTLREATKLLCDAGVPSPKYDAEELFRAALSLPRGALIDPGRDYKSRELEELIARRAAREPLQYILGEVGFFREEYTVTRDVLIPRSDTEMLVEYAVEHIPAGAHFLDLCTGSGCIAISTLKNTERTTATAVDISPAALAVARGNAERNGVAERLSFVECDLLASGIPECGERPYAILSNPPYVTASAYLELEEELYREPRIALVGGADGLDFYRRLAGEALVAVLPCGFVAFEIGYDQADALGRIAAEHGASCEILRDLGGCDRVAVLRRKN